MVTLQPRFSEWRIFPLHTYGICSGVQRSSWDDGEQLFPQALSPDRFISILNIYSVFQSLDFLFPVRHVHSYLDHAVTEGGDKRLLFISVIHWVKHCNPKRARTIRHANYTFYRLTLRTLNQIKVTFPGSTLTQFYHFKTNVACADPARALDVVSF